MELRGELVALEQLRFQRVENIVADLLLVAAILADQVMVCFAMNVLVVQWPIADGDRRNEPNFLQPLERAIHCRNIDIWVVEDNCGVDVFGC